MCVYVHTHIYEFLCKTKISTKKNKKPRGRFHRSSNNEIRLDTRASVAYAGGNTHLENTRARMFYTRPPLPEKRIRTNTTELRTDVLKYVYDK